MERSKADLTGRVTLQAFAAESVEKPREISLEFVQPPGQVEDTLACAMVSRPSGPCPFT